LSGVAQSNAQNGYEKYRSHLQFGETTSSHRAANSGTNRSDANGLVTAAINSYIRNPALQT
jgi:hypothetical protein